MAFHGQPVPGQGLEDLYQDIQAQWAGLDAVCKTFMCHDVSN